MITLNIIISVVSLRRDGKYLHPRKTSKTKFCIPTTLLTLATKLSCHVSFSCPFTQLDSLFQWISFSLQMIFFHGFHSPAHHENFIVLQEVSQIHLTTVPTVPSLNFIQTVNSMFSTLRFIISLLTQEKPKLYYTNNFKILRFIILSLTWKS